MSPDSNSTTQDVKSISEETELTVEEIEGFHIIRAILSQVVDPRKVIMRDAKSYCAILFNDNNRKPICRLRFNNPSKLTLGLFDEKEEKTVVLADLMELYKYSEQMKKTASEYVKTE